MQNSSALSCWRSSLRWHTLPLGAEACDGHAISQPVFEMPAQGALVPAMAGALVGTPTTANSGLTWNVPVTTDGGAAPLIFRHHDPCDGFLHHTRSWRHRPSRHPYFIQLTSKLL